MDIIRPKREALRDLGAELERLQGLEGSSFLRHIIPGDRTLEGLNREVVFHAHIEALTPINRHDETGGAN